MSFGSAIGAIVSLKNNRRNRPDRNGKGLSTTDPKSEGIKSHKKLSPAEMQELQNRISSENSRRQRKIFILTGIFLILIIGCLSYFMF